MSTKLFTTERKKIVPSMSNKLSAAKKFSYAATFLFPDNPATFLFPPREKLSEEFSHTKSDQNCSSN